MDWFRCSIFPVTKIHAVTWVTTPCRSLGTNILEGIHCLNMQAAGSSKMLVTANQITMQRTRANITNLRSIKLCSVPWKSKTSIWIKSVKLSVTWWSQPISNKPDLNDSDNGKLHSEILGCQALPTNQYSEWGTTFQVLFQSPGEKAGGTHLVRSTRKKWCQSVVRTRPWTKSRSPVIVNIISIKHDTP
jgi:hypothetical protein